MCEASSELERARQVLRQRGYLYPPPQARRTARFLRLALVALATSSAAALLAAGSGEGNLLTFFLLTASGWPMACLLAMAWAWASGRLASALVAWGHDPQAVSVAVAALGAAAVLLLMGATAGQGSWRLPAWAGLVAAGALVWLVFSRSRQALLARFHLERETGPLPAWLLVGALLAGASGFLMEPKLPHGMPLPPLAGFSPSARVVVLAVDGLSREDLEAGAQLLGGGLEQLLGFRWAPLTVSPGSVPAEFWTTVACGASPRVHGVRVVEETRPWGLSAGVALRPIARLLLGEPWGVLGLMPQVAKPTLQRRLPTFWEMAARAGYPVLVGGWWGSWPVRAFPGQVASERALLAGATSTDAVTPGLVRLVRELHARHEAQALRVSLLGEALAKFGARRGGPFVAAVAFPGLDLEARRSPSPPLALAVRQLPHLGVLGRTVEALLAEEVTVIVVGAPWHGGQGFVASSARSGGPEAPLPPDAIASMVLASLDLPLAPYHLSPPAWLMSGSLRARLDYGPPPPVASLPSAQGARLQREVLKSLGYL